MKLFDPKRTSLFNTSSGGILLNNTYSIEKGRTQWILKQFLGYLGAFLEKDLMYKLLVNDKGISAGEANMERCAAGPR